MRRKSCEVRGSVPQETTNSSRHSTCVCQADGEDQLVSRISVWQKSMNLADRCYRRRVGSSATITWSSVTKSGSHASQSPRTSPKASAGTTRANTSTLRFSGGSGNQLRTQVELSKRVEIVRAEEAAMPIADAEEIGRMLHGLIGSLEREPVTSIPYLYLDRIDAGRDGHEREIRVSPGKGAREVPGPNGSRQKSTRAEARQEP